MQTHELAPDEGRVRFDYHAVAFLEAMPLHLFNGLLASCTNPCKTSAGILATLSFESTTSICARWRASDAAYHCNPCKLYRGRADGHRGTQLWGAQDNLLPRADQETLAARIPGAVLKVYPDVAHMVLWECPERVAEDAAAFLASCD